MADAIAGYIGFSIIIQLPVVFMNSFEEFPQKGAVGKLEQKRRRADPNRPKIWGNWLFNFIYVVSALIYKSVFFYFFPFGSSLVPFFKSLQDNITGIKQ